MFLVQLCGTEVFRATVGFGFLMLAVTCVRIDRDGQTDGWTSESLNRWMQHVFCKAMDCYSVN